MKVSGRGWGLFSLVLTAAFLVLSAWFEHYKELPFGLFLFGPWLLSLGIVGWLIVSRQPGNPLGPLFLGIPLVMAFSSLCQSYAQLGLLVDPGSVPYGLVAAWITRWLGTLAFGAFVLILLLFPTGRLFSPGWRLALRAVVTAMVFEALVHAFGPGQVDVVAPIQNPYGIESLRPIAGAVKQASETVLFLGAVAAIVSLVLRYRRSSGTERQQLKWVAFATAAFPFIYGLAVLAGTFIRTPQQVLEFGIIMVGLFAFPAAIGVAILRYRLYDIDVVVNRALVYGAVSALTVGMYVGLVTVAQFLLGPIVAGSDLAVAISTLAVAAAFRPLRRGVQDVIDRRFYRRKFDATRVIENFHERVRRRIDLSNLSSELVSIVGETMQPRHVSLWMRAHAAVGEKSELGKERTRRA